MTNNNSDELMNEVKNKYVFVWDFICIVYGNLLEDTIFLEGTIKHCQTQEHRIKLIMYSKSKIVQ